MSNVYKNTASKNWDSVRKRIQAGAGKFTGAHQEVARFVLENPAKVAFMNAEMIAKEVGVSSASVVRFSQALGYEGFYDLKRAVQNEIVTLVSPADKVQSILSTIEKVPDTLTTMVESEIAYIQMILQSITPQQFNEAIELIAKAGRLGLFGTGGSRVLAEMLHFRLRRFKVDALLIGEGRKSMFEDLHWLGKGDTLLVIAFQDPLEEVLTSLRYAKDVGASTIVITDLESSPTIPFADVVLIGQRGPAGSFHSLVVPNVIVNALIIGYARRTMPDSLNILRDFQRIRNDYGDL